LLPELERVLTDRRLVIYNAEFDQHVLLTEPDRHHLARHAGEPARVTCRGTPAVSTPGPWGLLEGPEGVFQIEPKQERLPRPIHPGRGGLALWGCGRDGDVAKLLVDDFSTKSKAIARSFVGSSPHPRSTCPAHTSSSWRGN
jgi:hypothetical protein